MNNRYDDEVEYWKSVISENLSSLSAPKGELNARLDLNKELAKELKVELGDGLFRDLNILDVGCGPLSVVGQRNGDFKVTLTGVDPLADEYQAMLAEVGVLPPFALVKGLGEEVGELFAEDSFDIVYSRNALDHSQDPIAAIRSMIKVAKPGATIWINVNRNEGINAGYNGLHSWNFEVSNEQVFIWTPMEAQTLDSVVDGYPYLYRTASVQKDKICPEELDIIIHKDCTDTTKMIEVLPGVFASRSNLNRSITIVDRTGSLDSKYNFFLHGVGSGDANAWSKSFRWYPNLPRRSINVDLQQEISAIRIGQYDVSFVNGEAVYLNIWTAYI